MKPTSHQGSTHQTASTQAASTRSRVTAKATIWARMLWQEKPLNPKISQNKISQRSTSPPASSTSLISQIGQRINPSSLQFRLVVGVTTFSILGLAGVATWTSWKIEQILVNTHNQNVKQIAERFPDDVALYNDRLSVNAAVQQAIDSVASPTLLVWVRDSDGKMLAQSSGLNAELPGFVNRLLALSNMLLEPRVYAVEQRYFVLCSVPLSLEGETIGQLYLAQDITSDRLKQVDAIRDLSLVASLLVVIMAVAIALYIRQALRPLREINQIAATISANDLSQSRLALPHAPTEVQELAETLNQMLSRLGRSWEQQTQLIGDISHELRTPLSVAYGSLQCLQRRNTNLNDTQREMLDSAVSETHRTIQLLQDLLALARADSGCIYVHSETLNLNQLVADLVKVTKQLNDRVIQVEAEADKIWITTDRNCLNQILTNLIDNAVKYSPCNQPILIKLMQTQDHVTIQIQDYGCGIPLEQQSRIFDCFYRVDDARSRATGGTGLGLAIVKTLVQSMKGEITVWSEPGAGSLFTVTLPLQLKG